MAITSSYLVSMKGLKSFLQAVQTARAPERFTTKFLVQLGFKSTNDRLFIGLLKSLGFITDSGEPRERYFEFLDENRSAKVLAEGIQEAYEDLFRVNTKAHELPVDEVKNKLKTLTQGQKSEKVVSLMATTFKALCELADWSESTPPSKEEDRFTDLQDESKEKKIQIREPDLSKKPILLPGQGEVSLHYNLQIILPDTRDPAVFDAIFRSIREHLL